MKILVTGGTGYIGSHTCVLLLEKGHEILTIDNLSNSDVSTLARVEGLTKKKISFKNIDILDHRKLTEAIVQFTPDVVMHFAGLKSVSESVRKPLHYYRNNVVGSLNLLKSMEEAKCNKIIFSSSATVYGSPVYLPYDEDHPTIPINPYGKTKLNIEEMIKDWTLSEGYRQGICLRYFNPVGAHPSGIIGENPLGYPQNLMPAINKVAVGELEFLKVFGNSFDTRDGTGERDYIHIMDLAKAHVLAMERQELFNNFEVLNIGLGKGITVKELVEAYERVSNIKIKLKFVKKRDGDLPSFYANTELAKQKLNWLPEFNLYEMCKHSLRWQVKRSG